jgi:hypothetical protein
MISNSIVHKMTLREKNLYVDFKFTNVSTLYRKLFFPFDGAPTTLFSVGSVGKAGSCVVRFDSDLNPTLVGYSINT